jgi:hypothetical protein
MTPPTPTPRSRWRTRLNLASLAVIIFLPALDALTWASDPTDVARKHGTVVALDTTPAVGERTDYLAVRDARLDRLLPSAGGGRFFVTGLEKDGLAIQRENIILIKAPSAVELIEAHELAHLVQYNLPTEFAAIMRVTSPPAPDEYAAKSDIEHFAEMAAEAWTVVAGVRDACLMDGPADLLRDAEQRVPGTAGFVAYYLATGAFADDSAAMSVTSLAAEMIAPAARPAWQALWAALEARRQPDGTLLAWPRPDALARHRAQWEQFRTPVVRALVRVISTPSELVVRAVAG